MALTSIATPEDVDDVISELLLMVKVPPFMEIAVPVEVSIPPVILNEPADIVIDDERTPPLTFTAPPDDAIPEPASTIPPDTFKDPPVMEMGKPAETAPPDTVNVPDVVIAEFRSRVPDVVNVPLLLTPPLNSDLPDEVLLNVQHLKKMNIL